jgi:hypothetical protein
MLNKDKMLKGVRIGPMKLNQGIPIVIGTGFKRKIKAFLILI